MVLFFNYYFGLFCDKSVFLQAAPQAPSDIKWPINPPKPTIPMEKGP